MIGKSTNYHFSTLITETGAGAMKKILFLVLPLFLAGCAARYPLNANLNLQIISQTSGLYNGTSAYISSRDGRENPEVIIFQLTEGAAVRITNLNPPDILVSERLAGGFREQGLLFESSSPNRIVVEVKELAAVVTKPKLLYTTRATSRILLLVERDGSTLTKNYNLESNREGLSKPKVDELEKLLNTQLSDIAEQILQDSSIRTFLQKMR